MELETFEDILGFNNKEDVKALAFGNQLQEKIIFSTNVAQKINKFQQGPPAQLFMSESGTIFLSSTNDEGQMVIMRTFNLMNLKAMTLLEPEKTQQPLRSFILHHKTQWDSVLSCGDVNVRNKITMAVKYKHWTLFKSNLPIYRIPEKQLNRIVVKKERQNDQGVSRKINLPEKYRDFSQDMYAIGSIAA